jgi:hypothetical protein
VDTKDTLLVVSWDTDEAGSGSHVNATVSCDNGLSFCPPTRVEHSFYKTVAPNVVVVSGEAFLVGSLSDSTSYFYHTFFTRSSPITGLPSHGYPLDAFLIAEPYPNPFNSTVAIEYTTGQRVRVKLDVYTVLGQWVRNLSNGVEGVGRFLSVWDGKDAAGRTLASGIYLLKVSTPNNYAVKKLVYLR